MTCIFTMYIEQYCDHVLYPLQSEKTRKSWSSWDCHFIIMVMDCEILLRGEKKNSEGYFMHPIVQFTQTCSKFCIS